MNEKARDLAIEAMAAIRRALLAPDEAVQIEQLQHASILLAGSADYIGPMPECDDEEE